MGSFSRSPLRLVEDLAAVGVGEEVGQGYAAIVHIMLYNLPADIVAGARGGAVTEGVGLGAVADEVAQLVFVGAEEQLFLDKGTPDVLHIFLHPIELLRCVAELDMVGNIGKGLVEEVEDFTAENSVVEESEVAHGEGDVVGGDGGHTVGEDMVAGAEIHEIGGHQEEVALLHLGKCVAVDGNGEVAIVAEDTGIVALEVSGDKGVIAVVDDIGTEFAGFLHRCPQVALEPREVVIEAVGLVVDVAYVGIGDESAEVGHILGVVGLAVEQGCVVEGAVADEDVAQFSRGGVEQQLLEAVEVYGVARRRTRKEEEEK